MAERYCPWTQKFYPVESEEPRNPQAAPPSPPAPVPAPAERPSEAPKGLGTAAERHRRRQVRGQHHDG